MKGHRVYNGKEVEGIANGFAKVAELVRMQGPDHIFAPVIGAVPFIDILYIVDRHFPLHLVCYLPNSSRFANRNKLMSNWYSNFYKSNETGDKLKIVCLDEVLSGASAVNGYNQFRKSLDERAKEKARGMDDEAQMFTLQKRKLNKNLDYRIVGIMETGHTLNPVFKKLVTRGLVHTFPFTKVLTIDNVSLNIVRLKQGSNLPNGRASYLPEIERFEVSPDYLNFLKGIAEFVGVDPSRVGPVNLSKIEEDLKLAY